MADEDDLVSEIPSDARAKLRGFLARQPEERRLRLDGIDEMVETLERRFEDEKYFTLHAGRQVGKTTCAFWLVHRIRIVGC